MTTGPYSGARHGLWSCSRKRAYRGLGGTASHNLFHGGLGVRGRGVARQRRPQRRSCTTSVLTILSCSACLFPSNRGHRWSTSKVDASRSCRKGNRPAAT